MNKMAYVCAASLSLLAACTSTKIPQSAELDKTQATTTSQTSTAEATPLAEQSTSAKSTTPPTSFELSGAIAAKSHKKGWTASLNWVQHGPGQYQIRLIGPLGGQTVMIEKHNGLITYREGNKKLSSANGDDLLQKQTGIRLPVNSLYYWVRGISAPGAIQSAARDTHHQLITLKQAGYTIDYTQYMTVGQTTLPSKIRLQGHDVMIKLIVKHWRPVA